MKSYLVTGGAGFIGSCFVRYLLNNRNDIELVILDKLTYAGNLKNIENEISNPSVSFVKGDICNRELVEHIFDKHKIDIVVNFAAESHVDRSISNPYVFITTNVLGVQNLLDISKKYWSIGKDKDGYPVYSIGKKFIHISTDEVYGSLSLDSNDSFNESTNLSPRSPYSSSKASADLISMSYFHTYKFPINVTRCSNNYGPFQYGEKLIPTIIKSIMSNRDIPIYGEGKNVRDWIHVEDHVRAVNTVVENGISGNIYNIGGRDVINNNTIAVKILEIAKNTIPNTSSKIVYIDDRLGHDMKYSVDYSKIQKELNWSPTVEFDSGIKDTFQWYLRQFAST